MPRTIARVNQSGQLKAKTAAKSARHEEAGLGGPRTGKASATTRAAQARRDARRAAGSAAAAEYSAKTGPEPMTKRSRPEPPTRAVEAKTRPSPAHSKLRKKRETPMIEVRTSSSVPGSATLDAHVEKVVGAAIERFAGVLTRVDVYLSDENAAKGGSNDKRCLIEARPASRKPVSTTATAGTVQRALTDAAAKMKRLLATQFDRKPRRRPTRAARTTT
jgi:hypothetical protein